MKNFIIVGTQRTGSSAIAEVLGINPRITCGWEWTLEIPRRDKLIVAEKGLSADFDALHPADREHMLNVHTIEKQWLGFRWLFSASGKWVVHPRLSPALWIDRLEDFIEWVSQRPDIKIIHVARNNRLEWLKSIYMARKTRFYTKERYPEGFKVYIPNWEAISRLKAKHWIDKRLSGLKRTNPFICIAYEDFLKDQRTVASRACEFLGCRADSIIMESRQLKKQSKGDASTYIKNFENLKAKLLKTKLLLL
jgi:LPS sulfotransferase NodH